MKAGSSTPLCDSHSLSSLTWHPVAQDNRQDEEGGVQAQWQWVDSADLKILSTEPPTFHRLRPRASTKGLGQVLVPISLAVSLSQTSWAGGGVQTVQIQSYVRNLDTLLRSLSQGSGVRMRAGMASRPFSQIYRDSLGKKKPKTKKPQNSLSKFPDDSRRRTSARREQCLLLAAGSPLGAASREREGGGGLRPYTPSSALPSSPDPPWTAGGGWM